MIKFVHKQVVNDAFSMSFPEFKDFYEKNYELNKLECLIIWDGIREHVRDRDYSVVKSSFLLPSELDIIKKEVLSGIVKEKTIDIQDRIKEVMKDFENKTKKKKFFGLRKIGVTDNEAAEILNVSGAYLKYLIDEFEKLAKE